MVTGGQATGAISNVVHMSWHLANCFFRCMRRQKHPIARSLLTSSAYPLGFPEVHKDSLWRRLQDWFERAHAKMCLQLIEEHRALEVVLIKYFGGTLSHEQLFGQAPKGSVGRRAQELLDHIDGKKPSRRSDDDEE